VGKQEGCILYNLLLQYNFIDLRGRNSLLVRLRDKDAGWKDSCLKGRVEQLKF